jgi:L-alanine-DL-glutamate epimerase-like enolase superfamily enzyme
VQEHGRCDPVKKIGLLTLGGQFFVDRLMCCYESFVATLRSSSIISIQLCIVHRRNFLQQTITTAAGAALLPQWLCAASGAKENAIIIKSVQLLQWQKQLFVVVTDANGRKGITLCNQRMEFLSGIFNGLVAPFFVNKDARTIRQLVDDVYKEERNYKFSGMPFWNCVGHVEVAVWDLLGKIENKPVHQLLGTQLHTELPMYLSSLTRDNAAEAEVEKLLAALQTTGCKAVKVKVGGRMGNNASAEKRSYDIVKLLRKKAPASLTIYADANGSFDVKEGVAMGRFLEDNGVDIFEEPCPWEDFESNRRVNVALKKIEVAGGEQDTSFYRFEWYARNHGLDVLQPDTFYNGGITRTLRVAKLCQQHKKYFAPHSPKADPLEAPFLHLMAVAPAVYGFQEFPLSGVGKKQEGWWGPHFSLQNGKLSVPAGAGLGIEYDEEILKEGRVV